MSESLLGGAEVPATVCTASPASRPPPRRPRPTPPSCGGSCRGAERRAPSRRRVLGLGEDGDTASLFPGDPEIGASKALCRPVRAVKPPPDRVTLTLNVLSPARVALLLATGEGKAWALDAILRRPDQTLPASLLPPVTTVLVADRARPARTRRPDRSCPSSDDVAQRRDSRHLSLDAGRTEEGEKWRRHPRFGIDRIEDILGTRPTGSLSTSRTTIPKSGSRFPGRLRGPGVGAVRPADAVPSRPGDPAPRHRAPRRHRLLSILPVDQGIEHSAGASFAKNPDYFDPVRIVELAIEGGCNAVATTLGALGLAARRYAHRIPFMLKLNHNEFLSYPNAYDQIMFAS